MSGSTLVIDLAGERHEVRPPDALTFGRAADIVVDDNPYLHRIVGRFFWHADSWWLENLGRSVELDVVAGSGTVSRLPARDPDGDPVVVALATPEFRVLFHSGGFPYELLGTVTTISVPTGEPITPLGIDTVGYGTIDLTPDERQLLVLLAEPVLRDPALGPEHLPANRDIAERLGWPLSKFNRKLDHLCARLTKAGVKGLVGTKGQGGPAQNRRWRLVEHAINARLIKPTEVDQLPT